MAGRPRSMIDIQDELLAVLRGTRVRYELREGVWSVEGLFADEPVTIVRVLRPEKTSAEAAS